MVVRVHKTEDYTVLSNYHLKDKRLSLKAKGLLTQMLSLPDNWNYSINGLTAINKEGVTAIRNILEELKENNYVVVTKKFPSQTESGKYEYEYDIYEVPQDILKQDNRNQDIENLYLENPPLNKELNNKILIKDIDNINNINNTIYKAPQKQHLETQFLEVWSIYPRKIGKAQAGKAYLKAIKSGASHEDIVKGVRRYAEYVRRNKTEERYIKHGSTWFNQRCWEDIYDSDGRNKGTNGEESIFDKSEEEIDKWFFGGNPTI